MAKVRIKINANGDKKEIVNRCDQYKEVIDG